MQGANQTIQTTKKKVCEYTYEDQRKLRKDLAWSFESSDDLIRPLSRWVRFFLFDFFNYSN